MGIKCRIIRNEDGGIKYVEAPNGEASNIFRQAMIDGLSEAEALEMVLVANTPTFNAEVKVPKQAEFRRRLIETIRQMPSPIHTVILNLENLNYEVDMSTLSMESEFLGNGERLMNFTADIIQKPDLKAPNGKPSNLNERQYNEVRTTEFMEWSNNWNDVIKDVNGEPQVHYHGTPEPGFTVFNSQKGVEFFTPTAQEADSYGPITSAYKVYVKSAKPFNPVQEIPSDVQSFINRNLDLIEEHLDNTFRESVLADTNQESRRIATEQGENWQQMSPLERIDLVLKHSPNNWQILEFPRFLNFLRRKNYTSISTLEGTGNIGVLSNTQVKSATENQGTFDATNPDIRFSIGESNFERWRGNNELVDGGQIQNVRTGQPIVARVYHGTTHEFYEFDSSVKGTVEGHLGRVNYFTSNESDATNNYQADGPDLQSRIDRRASEIVDVLEEEYDFDDIESFRSIIEEYNITEEELSSRNITEDNFDSDIISDIIANRELRGQSERVLDLYVKLNNPLVLGVENNYRDFTDRSQFEEYIEDAEQEVAEENDITVEEAREDYQWDIEVRAMENAGYENPLYTALEEAISDNIYNYEDAGNIASTILTEFYESEININELETEIRRVLSENYITNEEGDFTSSQIVSDFFQYLGFDGIILTDVSKRFRGMGLDSHTSHVHVFDRYNNQIKLADGTNYNFGETSDIRYSQGETGTTSDIVLNALTQRLKINANINILDQQGINEELGRSAENVNGFVKNGEVYLNKDRASLETLLHEYSHIFNTFNKENNLELYNRGIELIQKEGQEYVDYVKQNQPELEGEALYEEALAQAIGDNGARLIEGQVKNNFNQWLRDFWNSIKEALGFTNITPQQLREMTLEEYTNRSVEELLNGFDVRQVSTQPITENRNPAVNRSRPGFNKGIERIAREANEFKREFNINNVEHPPVYSLNESVSIEIARAYEEMEHNPNDPRVKESYEAMMRETKNQYNFIVGKGLKVIRHEGEGEPYRNSREALRDLERNQLKFLPNEEAFGTNTEEYSDNIGLQDSGIKLEDGYKMTNSEVFRVVHDYFGHGILGNQFGAIGEENATLQHAAMFSPLAQPAMIAQTRGQNSWVNFSGANNEALELFRQARNETNREVAQSLREEATSLFKFAEPKIGLLPDKYNFTKYETARRIAEDRQIDRQANPRDNDIPTLLAGRVNESRSTRGVSQRSVQRTQRIRGNDVNVINEYTLDSEIDSKIKKVFPKFKGVQKIYEITNGDVFRELQVIALEDNEFKASVTAHTAEEYNQMRMFITEDGSTGITLTNDGFLGGAFSDPTFNRPNNIPQLMVLGIKEGAITAEAFDTILPDYYTNFGFKAVSRTAFNDEYKPMKANGALADWSYKTYRKFNNGRPDVVFFIYDGGNRDFIEDNLGQFDGYNTYEKANTTYYDKDSYDSAYKEMEVAAIKRGNFERSDSRTKFSIGFIHTRDNQVVLSNVESGMQGQGVGTEMYKMAAAQMIEEGNTLTSDFNKQGAFGIWFNLEEAGVAETTFIDGREVSRIKNQPDTFDQNGEPFYNEVIKFIQSKNYEGQTLNQEEVNQLRLSMVDKQVEDSEQLFTELSRAFMPQGVFSPSIESLVDSELYTETEARRLLNNEDALITAYDTIQKLKNTDTVENNISIEPNYITVGVGYDMLGFTNKQNPYINKKQAIDTLGGIKNESTFLNAVENSEMYYARNSFETLSQYNRVNNTTIDERGFRQTDSNDTLRTQLEETLTSPTSTELVDNLNYLLELRPEVWNENFTDVQTLLEQIEESAIDIGLDLSNMTDLAYDKTPTEVNNFLNSIRNFAVSQNETTFDIMFDEYLNYFTIEPTLNTDVVTLPQRHQGKNVVQLETQLDSYTLFNEHSLLPLGNNIYQRINKNKTLEEVVDTIYQHERQGNQILPREAFRTEETDPSYVTNTNNEVYVKRDIENYAQRESSKINKTESFSPEEVKKMVLFKEFFNTEYNNTQRESPEITNEINLINEFPRNAEYLTSEFIADFNKQQIRERRKNSQKYNEYYSNFEINNKGVRPINTDPLTMQQMEQHMTNDMRNHLRLQKDGYQFEVEPQNEYDLNIPLVQRNYYSNFPQAVTKFEGEYRIDNNRLITKVTQDFIKVKEGLYEMVDRVGEDSIYGRIPINTSNYKNYNSNFAEPNIGDISKFGQSNNAVQANKQINNLYTQRQGEQITNEIDNC